MQFQRATSHGAASPGPAAARLPAPIVEKAVTGLCWVSALAGVTSLLMTLAQYALQAEFVNAWQQPLIRLTFVFMFFLSVGFVVVQRNGWLKKERLLDFGLAFQILIAFGLAMQDTSMFSSADPPVIGVSRVAIWMVLCGFLMPNAPLRAGLAAMLCMLSWPLAYFVNLQVFHFAPLPWNRLAAWILPLIVTAAWMYLFNYRMVRIYYTQQRAEDLGNYKLDFQLGYGGMGEVWRAKHKLLARDAAIKLIRPDVLAAGSGREARMMESRFEREAQATARLRSPHTVDLFDFGKTKDGTYFYVMELLTGVDLQMLVDRYGPMEPGRVVRILTQVCESLEEAHQAGMVHRDIKPKNILLCKLGLQYDFAKVLDFGLVKVASMVDQTLLTMQGAATGTPAYLPPEIAMGGPIIDGRADLYSLGCVAYFLLTGQLVFEESTPFALTLAHAQKQPVPLQQRTELPIPETLADIVMQLLAKAPEDRIPSAKDLARRLRRLQDVPPWGDEEATRWWETNAPDVATQTPIREERMEHISDAKATAAW